MAGFSNITKIPELRKRILFTLFILAVYRLDEDGGYWQVRRQD